MTIACSLSAADHRQRLADLDQLIRDALLHREPIDGGTRLTFDLAARDRVEAMIAAEAACCPFLTLDLRTAGDRLVLDVTGPRDAAPIVEQLFA
jgi:MerR family transcriptional regulator, copper efflux regulator